MKDQNIKCKVHDCEHCNCEKDCCKLGEIEVCNCNCGNCPKEFTMCDSYEERKS